MFRVRQIDRDRFRIDMPLMRWGFGLVGIGCIPLVLSFVGVIRGARQTPSLFPFILGVAFILFGLTYFLFVNEYEVDAKRRRFRHVRSFRFFPRVYEGSTERDVKGLTIEEQWRGGGRIPKHKAKIVYLEFLSDCPRCMLGEWSEEGKAEEQCRELSQMLGVPIADEASERIRRKDERETAPALSERADRLSRIELPPVPEGRQIELRREGDVLQIRLPPFRLLPGYKLLGVAVGALGLCVGSYFAARALFPPQVWIPRVFFVGVMGFFSLIVLAVGCGARRGRQILMAASDSIIIETRLLSDRPWFRTTLHYDDMLGVSVGKTEGDKSEWVIVQTRSAPVKLGAGLDGEGRRWLAATLEAIASSAGGPNAGDD